MGRLPNKKKIKEKKKKRKEQSIEKSSQLSTKETNIFSGSSKGAKDNYNSITNNKTTFTKPAFIEKPIQFLREVKGELKKVTWPSSSQTMSSTAVVIILVLFISAFLGIVDFGLSQIARLIY